MNIINRILRILLGYIAGLLGVAVGLVAIWSINALLLSYWDLVQRSLWLGAGLMFSLLSYLMLQQSSRRTQ